MLMRFDPFRELDQLTEQLARQNVRPPVAMDAYRSGDDFHVEIDLPGVDPSTIDLTVEKNVLTVTATRRPSFTEGDQVLVAERLHGEVQRRLFLGEQLDADGVRASYDNGVLRLTMSVADHAKPRKVPVGTSGSRPQKELSGTTG